MLGYHILLYATWKWKSVFSLKAVLKIADKYLLDTCFILNIVLKELEKESKLWSLTKVGDIHLRRKNIPAQNY